MDNLVNNYYVLKQFVPALEKEILGYSLVEVFGQSKREYVFQFGSDYDHHSLTFFMGHKTCFTFLDQKEKPKSGTAEFFKNAVGQDVIGCGIFENDRSYYVQLTNDFCLVFKLHGVHGNVILFNEQIPVAVLRPNLKKDLTKTPDGFHQHINQDFKNFKHKLEEKEDAYKALKSLYPTFTSDFLNRLDQEGFIEKSSEEQWQLVQKLLAYLEAPPFYLFKDSPDDKKDPGWRFTVFKPGTPNQTFDSVLTGFQTFARFYLKDFQLLILRETLLDYWENEKAKIQKRINNYNKHLQKLIESYDYKTLADILMANLHQLKKGQESAELYDFYNDTMVTIPLKKAQSPQENAERYYRKGKNQSLELKHVEKNLEEEKKKLTEVEEMLESIREETNMKALRKLYKATFSNQGHKKQKTTNADKFKHFTIEGFDVYAGKGAKTNDLLTLQFANKNDLWLHAREQTGSHVIIRNKGVQEFPKPVIEKAAGLAAYYSKGKGESMCPVVYTRKKYVWKPKGSNPGQVNYKNETMIMAEPEPISDEQ